VSKAILQLFENNKRDITDILDCFTLDDINGGTGDKDIISFFLDKGYNAEYKEGVRLDDIEVITKGLNGYALVFISTNGEKDYHCFLFIELRGEDVVFWDPCEGEKIEKKEAVDKSRKSKGVVLVSKK
jgi:hypothetical protein